MIDKKTIEDAKNLALKEIKQFGHPGAFEEVNEVGIRLASKLKADKDVVLLGTILMDLKLGEALQKNEWPKHVKMSSDSVKKFLEKSKLTKEEKDKVINCVEAHHKEVPFKCIEAEICCNADCYRFLSNKRFLKNYYSRAKEGWELEKINDFMESKIDEKMKNLTLDICKKELASNYKIFKQLIKSAREK